MQFIKTAYNLNKSKILKESFSKWYHVQWFAWLYPVSGNAKCESILTKMIHSARYQIQARLTTFTQLQDPRL